ncbi:MAG TPA: cytochrome c oxidase accessory protein CcoG [Bacteroidia bacterium]|nr:cytochrome c oxidase accessory protein CcoG [Bacteroidia bacterium]
MNDLEKHPDTFRDKVSTIDKEGKRVWLYPHKPAGLLYKYRSYVSYFLLLLLFGLPYVKVEGDPLFLFNIIERKFILFGLVFWPQDFFLFGLAMLCFMVFIVLFTAVFGRLWCGWACPQTIFMEMVFRKIEYWFEGNSTQQKKLSHQDWNREKILKRGGKYIVFFLISFFIANTFLAYIIGSDELFKIISEPIDQHIGGFISILVFTAVFFFVFSYLREQVCIVVCPYGRLQGVLLDQRSIIVTYDQVRGEPREKFKKVGRDAGDCIDCHHCVDVCPTGIDIRNGTQLECINCTACIDACNHMMEKVGFDKGLIRYDSELGVRTGEKLKITPRIIGYAAVLLVLLSGLSFGLASRSDIELTLLRTPGMVYQKLDNGRISNLYNYKIVNKTRNDMSYTIEVEGAEGNIQYIGESEKLIKGQSISEGELFFIVEADHITARKTELKFKLMSDGKLVDEMSTKFIAPSKRK